MSFSELALCYENKHKYNISLQIILYKLFYFILYKILVEKVVKKSILYVRYKINLKTWTLKLDCLSMNPYFTIYLVCNLGVVNYTFHTLLS